MERAYRRNANGTTTNYLTMADAELILKTLDVENWLANVILHAFGRTGNTSRANEILITGCANAIAKLNEGRTEDAQVEINDVNKYFITFNEEIKELGDHTAFNYAEYEAKKNMATDKQISYLTVLLKKAGREMDLSNLTKVEASALISELKA